MNRKIANLFLIFICICTQQLWAQSDSTAVQERTLNQQFLRLKKSSNSWEAYKVIKKDKLEQFWGVVSDTLEWKDKEIVELKAETKLAQEKETQLNANIDLLKEQLKETQFEVDHIKVIGIDFTKKGFVYGGGVLLLVLILLLVVAIVKMNVSNRSASVARKDLEELRDEFENFQKRVLEKEKKLKRELTNEMNKCEELKQKLKSR